jgi:hypothetical protein
MEVVMKKIFVVLALAPVVLAAGCMYKSEREVERNPAPEKETVEKHYYDRDVYVAPQAPADRVDVHINR